MSSHNPVKIDKPDNSLRQLYRTGRDSLCSNMYAAKTAVPYHITANYQFDLRNLDSLLFGMIVFSSS